MNKFRKWTEIGSRTTYKIDKRWKRRIIKFGPFYVWESIRVIQYKESDSPTFKYERGVGIPDYHSLSDSSIVAIYQRMLNVFLQKEIIVKDVRSSKYVDKYPFVCELFKSVMRNKKLEQLGI